MVVGGGALGGGTAACQRLKHENILSVTYMGLKCRASVLILVHFFFLFFFRIRWSGSCHSRRQAGCCGFEAGDHTESNIHSPDNKTIWCFFFIFRRGLGGYFLITVARLGVKPPELRKRSSNFAQAFGWNSAALSSSDAELSC